MLNNQINIEMNQYIKTISRDQSRNKQSNLRTMQKEEKRISLGKESQEES